jgi:hypothetical protein
MKGFIFGFQRFVWCPKWTPASNNSGTNSVVSAIRETPRRRELPEREREDATAAAGAQPEIRIGCQARHGESVLWRTGSLLAESAKLADIRITN